jgi:hypothetical protein
MFHYFGVEFDQTAMKEMVEDKVVEEYVKKVDVFADVGIVFTGFDAFAHYWDEG